MKAAARLCDVMCSQKARNAARIAICVATTSAARRNLFHRRPAAGASAGGGERGGKGGGEQQWGGVGGGGGGQRPPLRDAAREGGRIVVGEAVKSELVQHRAAAVLGLARGDTANLEPQHGVAECRPPGQQ